MLVSVPKPSSSSIKQDLHLTQNVTEATMKRSGSQQSILDYIITNEDNLVDSLQYLISVGNMQS